MRVGVRYSCHLVVGYLTNVELLIEAFGLLAKLYMIHG